MNRSIMLKTVLFLIFTVVLLPSLGLTSISAFVIWSFTAKHLQYEWKCIFLPDNGSFFVNYVITAAFTGVIIQLLRLPEVFFCMFGIMKSKSEAEKFTIRQSTIWDYTYGIQYANALLIFTLVMIYSLLCPIIAPFGLVYFLFKMVVDRYNICFRCGPSYTSQKVHLLAIQFMLVALVLKDVGLFLLIYVRGGLYPVAYASQALAWFTIATSFFSMNPCKFKFLPRTFLMPHQVCLKTYRDYSGVEEDEDSTQKHIYQPLALRKYIHLISPLDKYENPLRQGADALLNEEDASFTDEDSTTSDDSDDTPYR